MTSAHELNELHSVNIDGTISKDDTMAVLLYTVFAVLLVTGLYSGLPHAIIPHCMTRAEMHLL